MTEHLTTTDRDPDKDRNISLNGAERTGSSPIASSDPSAPIAEPKTQPESTKEASKTQKVLSGVAIAAALTAGGAKTVEAGSDSEIDPITQASPETTSVPEHLDVEGINIGDGLITLNQTLQFSTDKVNVRKSPEVDKSAENNNLADTPDKIVPGSQQITVLHPIVVEDDVNPSNGRWFGFIEADGKVYWVNENALIEAGYQIDPATSEVVVVETSTNGIVAKPKSDPQNGAEIVVGTAVRD